MHLTVNEQGSAMLGARLGTLFASTLVRKMKFNKTY